MVGALHADRASSKGHSMGASVCAEHHTASCGSTALHLVLRAPGWSSGCLPSAAAIMMGYGPLGFGKS